MDVCRNAVPHVGTCGVEPSSWTNNRPIFRTKEAQEIQPGSCPAKLVIFAQAGQAHMAEALASAAGVHDTRTGTQRGHTRHTDALCATLQASAWSA